MRNGRDLAAAPNVTSSPLIPFLLNLAEIGPLAAAEFSKQFLAAGTTAPAS